MPPNPTAATRLSADYQPEIAEQVVKVSDSARDVGSAVELERDLSGWAQELGWDWAGMQPGGS